MISTTHFKALTILLASAIWLAGCASAPRVVHQTVPLPLPARPTLTPVSASAVQCLTDATYIQLVNREGALRTWGLKLEAIIQSNNRNARGNAKPE